MAEEEWDWVRGGKNVGDIKKNQDENKCLAFRAIKISCHLKLGRVKKPGKQRGGGGIAGVSLPSELEVQTIRG